MRLNFLVGNSILLIIFPKHRKRTHVLFPQKIIHKYVVSNLITIKTEILAWRKFPEPSGENYTDEQLCEKQKVIELFDYCQVLEAVIFDKGWKYLFDKYGLKGIIEIDSKSQWMNDEDIGEWITSIFFNSLISGFEPLQREYGKYDEKSGMFTNSDNEIREINWKEIYQLKENYLQQGV